MSRIAALVTGLALALIPLRADAAPQKLTVLISSSAAERGAAVCTTNCSTALVTVPENSEVAPGRFACAGTSLAATSPVYRCSVFVGAALFGRAVAANVPVKVTFEVVSDDGSPWNDEVRRTIRGQAPVMQPPASGVPSPCSADPKVDTRVTCARLGPRTWSASATTKSRTGLWVMPLQIEFPSTTATERVCEYVRLKGTAKSAGQTARIDLGRRRYCA